MISNSKADAKLLDNCFIENIAMFRAALALHQAAGQGGTRQDIAGYVLL